jgi:RNA polymerase sigma factor (sigma-70 family)
VSIGEKPSRPGGYVQHGALPPLTPLEIDRVVLDCAEHVSFRTGVDEDDLRAEANECVARLVREWKPALRVAPRAYLRRRLMWALYDCTKRALRRERFHGPFPEPEEIVRGMWSNWGSVAPEDLILAARVIEGLPPRERHVMTLRFWAGADNAEIAAELGVSVATVERAVANAMARMRKASGTVRRWRDSAAEKLKRAIKSD